MVFNHLLLLVFVFGVLLHATRDKNQDWHKMPKDYFNWDDARRTSITIEEKEEENVEKALEFIDQILR